MNDDKSKSQPASERERQRRQPRQFSLRWLFFFTFAVGTLLGVWVMVDRLDHERRTALLFLLAIGYAAFPVFFLFIQRHAYWFPMSICLLGLLLGVRYGRDTGPGGEDTAGILLFFGALWATIFGIVYICNERKPFD